MTEGKARRPSSSPARLSGNRFFHIIAGRSGEIEAHVIVIEEVFDRQYEFGHRLYLVEEQMRSFLHVDPVGFKVGEDVVIVLSLNTL